MTTQTMTTKKNNRIWNMMKTYFKKPENAILLVLGIVLSIFTLAPIASILIDTVTIHAGTIETAMSGKPSGSMSLWSFQDLFLGNLSKRNLRTPFANTMKLAFLSSSISLIFGGLVAYLMTRTNMKYKKLIAAIFLFPYIMPQWTLAVVWQNLFNSNAITGGADGILAGFFGINAPLWVAEGLFPSAMVLGIHYAPFAYILIGGVLKNMDANLEEAATILNTPKLKSFFRVTLPIVLPAILSTVLLVFSSSVGSYPVPHYLKYRTMTTTYMDINGTRPGSASILSVIMILIGLTILTINQLATSSRKSYATVTGKSGQIGENKLGKRLRYIIPISILVILFFTSIFPIISFAFQTFLQNPGDYSSFTTKWWLKRTSGGEDGMYGQAGILYNKTIWTSFMGTLRVAVFSALAAGIIGLLVGYAVSKKRKSKWANYVNGIAFLPYLLPALSVGAAYYVFAGYLNLRGTFLILIVVGTVKYIPFASRASLGAMMQLSPEIEESAIIQNIPWHKRMFRIVIPIQKTAIISGFLLPFITAMRELTLFMMLVKTQDMLITTNLSYFDEMGLYAFSSGINLILIVFILLTNGLINKLTGASLDEGMQG